MTEKALVIQETTRLQAMSIPDSITVERELAAVRAFQMLVRKTLIEGHDYGIIPGTSKPTLLKPGAEKIAKLLNLADTYEILSKTEDWKGGFFAYEIRATLSHRGEIVSTGLGECNSMEAKYRWRWIWPDDVPEGIDHTKLVFRKTKNGGKQYRFENDDIYSQVNTLLKMAKKRALVDAALSASRLSDIFTQDIEDLRDNDIIKDEPGESPGEASTDSQYYCKDHKTLWFKRGKMQSYAHPVEGSKNWCYMPTAKPESEPLKITEKPPVAVKTVDTTTEPPKQAIGGQQGQVDTVKISAERKDQLSRALTAAGYMPGPKRVALFELMNIVKLEELSIDQGNALEAWCKRKEVEKEAKALAQSRIMQAET